MSGKYEYTDDMVEQIHSVCSEGVTEEVIESLMAEFDFPRRSVTAKLRRMEYDVPKKPGEAPKFTDEETSELKAFLQDHEGEFTAEEIASDHFPKFTSRQITGKALSLEMTGSIKPAEKKVTPKTYSEEEEATIVSMHENGAYLEEIAEALGKSVNSVRGKCLSMQVKVPQRDKKEAKAGAYDDIVAGSDLLSLTFEEIAEKLDKTTRGVKTVLSRRKLACANYTPKTLEESD